MKIAIMDDLLECRIEIHNCLNRFFRSHNINETLSVTEFANGEDFLSVFQNENFDLIFIDQYMQGTSGMETAKQIRQKDTMTILVFITTSRDHAIESYEVKASGYLLKPFSYAEFERTMLLLDLARLRNTRYITVLDDKLLLREILWCDMDRHYVCFHTQHRYILRYRISFSSAADKLLEFPQFLSCYKGCIVNLDHVIRLEDTYFILSNNENIPFSKRDRKRIEQTYHNYLFQTTREEVMI